VKKQASCLGPVWFSDAAFHQAWLTNITRSREPLTSFAPPSHGRTAPTAAGGRMRRTSGNTAKGEAASRSTRRRPFLIEDCDSFAMVTRLICGVVLRAAGALTVERGEEIRLWAKGAPGSEGQLSHP